jgi:hypothetical protein
VAATGADFLAHGVNRDGAGSSAASHSENLVDLSYASRTGNGPLISVVEEDVTEGRRND